MAWSVSTSAPLRLLRTTPHLWISLLVGAFFAYYAVLPPVPRLLFVVLLVALNLGLGHVLKLALGRRMQAEASRWPELLVATLLGVPAVLLGATPFLALILLAVLLGWTALQAWLKNTGSFAVGLLGFLLVLVVLVNYRMLYATERLYLLLLTRQATADQTGPPPRWVLNPGQSSAELILAGEAMMVVIPAGLFLHGSVRALPLRHRAPRGRVLGTVSSQADNSLAAPVVAFYALNSRLPLTPGDFRSSFEVYLSHLERGGDVAGVRFAGKMDLVPPASRVRLSGLSWTARNLRSGHSERFTIYLLLSRGGQQYAVSVRERFYRGIRHHPDVLAMLRGLDFRVLKPQPRP